VNKFDETVQKLIEILRKKKEYMCQLKSLALKQKQVLEDKDPEALSEILDTRDKVIAEVDLLDAQAGKLKLPGNVSDGGSFKDKCRAAGSGQGQSEDCSSEIEGLEKEINDLAREIYYLDLDSIKLAQKHKEELQEKLKDLSLYRRSKDLYKGRGKKLSGVFLNKQR